MTKLNQTIINRIQKVTSGKFDDDCIKLLLIEIREKLKGETFLKEICHFIAHPERDTGICHKKVDVRYAKLKFATDNLNTTFTEEFMKDNKDKPERFFSDKILSYVSTDKIKKDLFELLILSGVDDLESKLFEQFYKHTRKQIKDIIKSNYKLENGWYQINRSISPKKYAFIDDVLKFIRGTVTGKPIFTGEEIYTDFKNGLTRLSIDLAHNINVKDISLHKNDIIVCILSLLHDSSFKLFDNSIGKGILSVTPKESSHVICLMSETGKFSIPLITTDISISEYIEGISPEFNTIESTYLQYHYCKRNSIGKLILTNS